MGGGAAYTEFAPGLKQYPQTISTNNIHEKYSRTISTNNFHEQYPLLKQLPNHPRWSTQIIINVSTKCNPSVSFFTWNISYRKPILCGVLLVISCPRDTIHWWAIFQPRFQQNFSWDFKDVTKNFRHKMSGYTTEERGSRNSVEYRLFFKVCSNLQSKGQISFPFPPTPCQHSHIDGRHQITFTTILVTMI